MTLPFLRQIATMPIRAYQRYISPLFPPSCRYAPTCSNYTLEAISTHGILKGSLLAIWRLLRCNPWTRGGVDYVPPRGRWIPEPWMPPADWPGHTLDDSLSHRTPMGFPTSDLHQHNEAPHGSLVYTPPASKEAERHTDLPASAGRPLKTSSSTNVRSHECLN